MYLQKRGGEGKTKVLRDIFKGSEELRKRNINLLSLLTLVLFIGAVLAVPVQNVWAVNPFTVKGVSSTSLVFGQEGRYTIEFQAMNPVTVGAGSVFTAEFPGKSSLIKNDILNENPGCTLANVQYKKSGAKYYSVLQGTVTTTDDDSNTIFNMTLNTGQQSDSIPANTSMYLTVPGVVNKVYDPGAGVNNNLILSFQPVAGTVYSAPQYNATIGDAPSAAPTGLTVTPTGSSKVSASWNTVAGAIYYQLLFSSQADGSYMQASDFSNKSREPNPGEQESLTTTSTTFSGGNSGLIGDRTYYFKVRAGNQYGYGPLSEAVSAKTLAIKPVTMSPADDATGVSLSAPISVTLNEDATINTAHYIQLFEKATGTPVTISQCTASAKTVNITATLKANTSYQVVFYWKALKSSSNSLVYNENFDWSFTTGGGN
ncbi:MAG: Ig-like domain-containing protein [Syntrophomonas sp.]